MESEIVVKAQDESEESVIVAYSQIKLQENALSILCLYKPLACALNFPFNSATKLDPWTLLATLQRPNRYTSLLL